MEIYWNIKKKNRKDNNNSQKSLSLCRSSGNDNGRQINERHGCFKRLRP